MQQAVAQPFRLGLGKLALEADEPGPAEQVLGDQRELQPGLVVSEAVVREVAHPGVLPGPDRVLDPRAAAVTQLQDRDVLAGLVGEKAGVSVPVLVEDLKLGAGVRPLAPGKSAGTPPASRTSSRAS